MNKSSTTMYFKFKFIKDSTAQSIFSTNGTADEKQLIIGKDTISYDLIYDYTSRDSRLIIILNPVVQLSKKAKKNLTEENALILDIRQIKAKELEKFISRISSKISVSDHKQQLIEEGKENLFKSIICPNCEAHIDLTDLKNSKFIYCDYCETVFSSDGKIVTNGDIYKLCDECNLFGRVKGYTETYFYFLLIIYGYRYQRRYLCDCCVNKIFWKTLLYNLIFILGIPSSIWLKIKSLSGRNDTDKNLLEATRLSIKGEYRKAEGHYTKLHSAYSGHPGVFYNEAMGYFNGQQYDLAVKCINKSLENCSNYMPTIRLVMHIQNLKGKNE